MTAIVPLFVSAGDDAGAPRKAGSDAQVMKKAWTAEVVGNLPLILRFPKIRCDCGEEVAMILRFEYPQKSHFPNGTSFISFPFTTSCYTQPCLG